MLIDSGSRCNVITEKTWQFLKESKIYVTNQIRKPNKILVPYGNKKPLDVIGSFNAIISVGEKNKESTVYIIKWISRSVR